MINIFLSYSGKDIENIEIIINNLRLVPGRHNLWHYKQNEKISITMEEVKKILLEIDLFIVIISHNSLSSPNVQQELEQAINLTKKGQIKEIYPILLDETINIHSDDRIPQYIKNNVICGVSSPLNAAQIIQNVILKY